MAGWRLEAGKMFCYLAFPIVAYIIFNHPLFYERSLRQGMQIMSKDVNLEALAELRKHQRKEETDKLGNLIDELESESSTKKSM